MPGRGRGGRKFDFDEDLGYDDDATHGDLDWYKPNKVVDSPIHLPETKKPVKLGRPPTKRKRGRPRLGLGKPGSKKPACIANTEDAENEGDLANKGLDFLVKHAAEHKIPKKQREGKAADLASGLATNSIFFLFPFCKKSLICLEGKSMTPHRGNTILFRSSQQLPRLCLGPSKGFLS